MISKLIFTLLTALFSTYALKAQAADDTVILKKGESDIQFVQRITGHSVTPADGKDKQIARTLKFIKDKDVLTAFVETPSEPASDETFDIELNLFTKKTDTTYTQTGIQACEVEGGSPTLRSFFYLNVDSEPDLEIGVICGWDATHQGADCQANDNVRFFKLKNGELEAVQMDQFKKVLYEQRKPNKKADFDCTYTKFKSAADVKKLIK